MENESGIVKAVYDNSTPKQVNYGVDITLDNGQDIRCYTDHNCSNLNNGDSVSFQKVNERTAKSGNLYWNIANIVTKASNGNANNTQPIQTNTSIRNVENVDVVAHLNLYNQCQDTVDMDERYKNWDIADRRALATTLFIQLARRL